MSLFPSILVSLDLTVLPMALAYSPLNALLLLVGIPLVVIVLVSLLVSRTALTKATRDPDGKYSDPTWVGASGQTQRVGDQTGTGALPGRTAPARAPRTRVAPVPDGEALSFSELERIKRAVRNAETSSGLAFSVFVGPAEDGQPRAYAERLHTALDDPPRSVLVLCDPAAHALEIVTGSAARRNLDDLECGLAAASMESSFAGGDIVGGLVLGIQQLGEASRAPRTLHASRSGR